MKQCMLLILCASLNTLNGLQISKQEEKKSQQQYLDETKNGALMRATRHLYGLLPIITLR